MRFRGADGLPDGLPSSNGLPVPIREVRLAPWDASSCLTVQFRMPGAKNLYRRNMSYQLGHFTY
ncbi:hypothetical protein LINPERHAP2_LOCUS16057 [Linum perenne]